MSNPPYGQVDVVGAPEYNGLRVDHPRLLAGVRKLLEEGYGNEHIGRIIGVPPSIVDKERSKLKK